MVTCRAHRASFHVGMYSPSEEKRDYSPVRADCRPGVIRAPCAVECDIVIRPFGPPNSKAPERLINNIDILYEHVVSIIIDGDTPAIEVIATIVVEFDGVISIDKSATHNNVS